MFDITDYVNKHPGGPRMMTQNAGLDVTAVFNRVGHSARARTLLADMYVGDLVLTGQAAAAARTRSGEVITSGTRSLAPPP